MVQYCLVIIAAALVGGIVPLVAARSQRVVHVLIAISAGFFLGVVFTHLLPEVAERAQEIEQAEHGAGHSHTSGHVLASEVAEEDTPEPHSHGSRYLWLWVLIGLLAIYLGEKLVVAGRGSIHDQHLTLSLGSAFGLGTHAFAAGLGLAATGGTPEILNPVFTSIVSHKSFEAFSLVTALVLADIPRRKILVFAALFSLVTPLGVILGSSLFAGADQNVMAILIAFATGSFLYVAVCDLLPEVFHHRRDLPLKLVMLVLGVLASMWI